MKCLKLVMYDGPLEWIDNSLDKSLKTPYPCKPPSGDAVVKSLVVATFSDTTAMPTLNELSKLILEVIEQYNQVVPR